MLFSPLVLLAAGVSVVALPQRGDYGIIVPSDAPSDVTLSVENTSGGTQPTQTSGGNPPTGSSASEQGPPAGWGGYVTFGGHAHGHGHGSHGSWGHGRPSEVPAGPAGGTTPSQSYAASQPQSLPTGPPAPPAGDPGSKSPPVSHGGPTGGYGGYRPSQSNDASRPQSQPAGPSGGRPTVGYGSNRPTITVTYGGGQPTNTYEQQPTVTYVGQSTDTSSEQQPTVTYGGQPTNTYGGEPPTSTESEDQPTSTYGGNQPTPTGGGSTGGSGEIGLINTYDSAYNIPIKQWSPTLEANAYKTVKDGNGQNMNHELNPGSMGQVLASGTASDFEGAYVGGWLCEVGSDPQLAGKCGNTGYTIDGTGHHDILTSSGYTQIGCAFFADPTKSDGSGLWGCDVA